MQSNKIRNSMTEVEVKCMQCGLSVDHFLELTDKMVSELVANADLQLPTTCVSDQLHCVHACHLHISRECLALRPPDHPGLPQTATCQRCLEHNAKHGQGRRSCSRVHRPQRAATGARRRRC